MCFALNSKSSNPLLCIHFWGKVWDRKTLEEPCNLANPPLINDSNCFWDQFGSCLSGLLLKAWYFSHCRMSPSHPHAGSGQARSILWPLSCCLPPHPGYLSSQVDDPSALATTTAATVVSWFWWEKWGWGQVYCPELPMEDARREHQTLSHCQWPTFITLPNIWIATQSSKV